MPGGVASVFGEAEDFEVALRIGERIRFDLHRLWVQRLSENLPRTCILPLSAAARSSPVPPKQDRSCTGVVRNCSRATS
jgi:hypothetical protein